MQLQLPPNPKKGDVISMLDTALRVIKKAKGAHYDMPWVTKESWEYDPKSRISFSKDKIPALKAAGLMKDPKEYSYGYHFPNEYMAKVRADLSNIEKCISEICDYLDDYILRPKIRQHTEIELSRFTIITGGGHRHESWLYSHLKEGALDE